MATLNKSAPNWRRQRVAKIEGDSQKRSPLAKPQKEADKSTYSGRVAARLRELRNAKNWTVPYMAERLLTLKLRSGSLSEKNPLKASVAKLPDVDTSNPDAYKEAVALLAVRIRHYEAGRADLPQDLFPAWAKVLGVAERDLLP